jgi:exodeoxyribonuclease VII large subunit
MTVNTLQPDHPLGECVVEIGLAGELLAGPIVLVPAAADQPVIGRKSGFECLQAGNHLVHALGTHQIGPGEGTGKTEKVSMSINQAGKNRTTLQVVPDRIRISSLHGFVVAYGEDFTVSRQRHGTAVHHRITGIKGINQAVEGQSHLAGFNTFIRLACRFCRLCRRFGLRGRLVTASQACNQCKKANKTANAVQQCLRAVYHLSMSDLILDTQSGFGETVYTPSELNREVRVHLEAGFPHVSLEGEISNLARPASGHLYFSLKDDAAQIRCAMFRTSASRMTIRPANGALVLARGRISLYEPRGEFQFIVDSLQEAGVGLLQQRFEELKARLQAEGLFAAEHKRPLPGFPLRIGVITSPSGAVIRDILHVLQRRWPVAEVRLYPSPVQGVEAPAALRSALAQANRENWAEVLILARGGGSLEDLQAFNDESVARAVAASRLPVISAVGHETDYSICDFVADVRAPTPSAAAEIATPDGAQLRLSLERTARLLRSRMQHRLQQFSQKLDHLSHRLGQQHPAVKLVAQNRQLSIAKAQLARVMERSVQTRQSRLQELNYRLKLRHPQRLVQQQSQRLLTARQRLQESLWGHLTQARSNLQQLARTLNAVSPLATLDRGYAVISLADRPAVVSGIGSLQAGQQISAQLADGRLYCSIDRISAETLLAAVSDPDI